MHRVLQFRLKTFFIITTILSVIVGVAVMRYQHRLKLTARYVSFEGLYRATEAFDTEVKAKILTLPGVLEALQENSETAPENYLTGGYGSFSSLGHTFDGHDQFVRDYTYQWPNEAGSYDDQNKVDITISAQLNMESFDKHVVELEYADTQYNREIAAWMEQEMTKHFEITVIHRQSEPVDHEPNRP